MYLPVCVCVQERLQQYYSSRVVVSPEEVLWAQRLCVDICTEIQGFLLSTHPDMPLGEFSLGGALLDDLEVHTHTHTHDLEVHTHTHTTWRYTHTHTRPGGTQTGRAHV